MQLFDNIPRDDDSPSRYAEPTFVFLNRSSRSTASSVRKELEKWFANYPASDKLDLRNRFRSSKDSEHASAFLELFLHELLLRLGCDVKVHPDIGNDTDKRPDFLVTHPEGSDFYLEAVLATAQSEEEAAKRARENEVYDSLNRLESPDFFLWIDVSGAPESPPPAKRIRAFLRERLDRLDPDEIASIWNAKEFGAIPSWTYEHDGWKITFRPIPKSPKSRGVQGLRPIGTLGTDFKLVDSRTPLRKAIERKAGRYGDLDQPYVIVVNSLDPYGIENIDVLEALFGREQFLTDFGITGATSTEFKREPDGAWIGRSGPKNTRISAVLLFNRLMPMTITRTSAILIHNPWAKRPYDCSLCTLQQWIFNDGRRESINGLSVAELLQMEDTWPD